MLQVPEGRWSSNRVRLTEISESGGIGAGVCLTFMYQVTAGLLEGRQSCSVGDGALICDCCGVGADHPDCIFKGLLCIQLHHLQVEIF